MDISALKEIIETYKKEEKLELEDQKELEKLVEFPQSIVLEPTFAIEPEKINLSLIEPEPVPASEAESTAVTSEKKEESQDIRTQISKMRLPEKVKLGMFGNATCRILLIRDVNKMIQNCVLKNPKLTATEVEEFAKNKNLSENVLRGIGGSQVWMKSYTVKRNLVFNSKTPMDISLRWMKFLNMDDIRRLAKSKNVPQVLVVAAKKKVSEEAEKNK